MNDDPVAAQHAFELSSTIVDAGDELAELAIGVNEPVATDIHYCNPDAKIVLITKDRVALRVEAWHMSRQR